MKHRQKKSSRNWYITDPEQLLIKVMAEGRTPSKVLFWTAHSFMMRRLEQCRETGNPIPFLKHHHIKYKVIDGNNLVIQHGQFEGHFWKEEMDYLKELVAGVEIEVVHGIAVNQ